MLGVVRRARGAPLRERGERAVVKPQPAAGQFVDPGQRFSSYSDYPGARVDRSWDPRAWSGGDGSSVVPVLAEKALLTPAIQPSRCDFSGAHHPDHAILLVWLVLEPWRKATDRWVL